MVIQITDKVNPVRPRLKTLPKELNVSIWSHFSQESLEKISFNSQNFFNYHLKYTRCTFIRCVNGWTVLIEGSSFFVNKSLKNIVARQDQDIKQTFVIESELLKFRKSFNY